ncbi:hypothetical protein GCM10010390_87750 [Streptomyces mordarskii]|uniref:Transposase n=1 Tax=Streptomyces mordarskii TaxID=1226758 RepID=A0ABN1EQ68_9ACTN
MLEKATRRWNFAHTLAFDHSVNRRWAVAPDGPNEADGSCCHVQPGAVLHRLDDAGLIDVTRVVLDTAHVRAKNLRRPLLDRLAPPRHPGHRRTRLPHRTAAGPKSRHTGLALHQTLDALQDLLNCWTGICTTCHQPLPSRTTPRSRQT